MKQVFVLQNQHKRFLNRQNEWVDGREAGTLYKTPHKDEAINQMVEASAKDYTQRVRLLACPLNSKNQPQIEADELSPVQANPDAVADTAPQTADTDASHTTAENPQST